MFIKISLVLVALALANSPTFSQKDYAVLTKGDTLKGELKILSVNNLDRLQINTGQKKVTYSALQVKSFCKDNVIYQPVKYDNAFLFMQILKHGYLSIYAFNPGGLGRWDGRYLLKKDGSGLEVPTSSFKKLLSRYLGDCPEIANRIGKGEFTRNDIDRIVVLYNDCLEAKTEALMGTKSASSASLRDEKIIAVTKLSEKVEAAQNFLTKKDVTDLLHDIKSKLSSNQPVPNYLTEGLKSYLADTPDLLKEAEELIMLLKK